MKYMKKKIGLLAIAAFFGILSSCGVSRQVSEAKIFADCIYDLKSIDQVTLAGIDINEFKNIKSLEDFDIAKYPRVALAALRKDIPLELRVNLDITNPTRNKAAINQMEYKVLLTNNEIFSGYVNELVEVFPGTGKTTVPIKLSANIYQLLSDNKTRDEFVNLVTSLTGKSSSKPSKLVIKLKPTLDLAGKQMNYPGYITMEKEINADMLLGIK